MVFETKNYVHFCNCLNLTKSNDWVRDSKTIFYQKQNTTKRHEKVWLGPLIPWNRWPYCSMIINYATESSDRIQTSEQYQGPQY